jgi:hypothetical protein
MSIATAILGNSGTGKTASIRNLDPERVLFIQAINKPLPFKHNWQPFQTKEKKGTIFTTDNAAHIAAGIEKAESIGKDIVIIDDFQYILSNEFMKRSNEKGFDKFADIGRHGWDVMNAAINAPGNTRVYILCHTASDDYGQNIRMKTIGKMLDEKIVLEGMLTLVLRTHVESGKYLFSTRNNGNDTVKTPMGMFESEYIENDLAQVDRTICEFYNIDTKKES